ncbi:sulfotransferase family protein [Nocardia sp. NPDC057455]|uniref:sulfotransferase family protein n=1 Tax=Nocardia sp. NPDC057455 TaxID=3346138 RepID=UPI0036710177
MADLHAETVEDVLAIASERTGHTELDSASWKPGLELVLEEINTNPSYTPFGRQYLLDECVKVLERRLKVHHHIREYPEILEEKIERPLVILGMPRTGTTVISYLLDQDPARRSLLHWECMQPVPPPTTETLRTDPRCLAMLEEQKAMLEMIQQANMALPHWEDADGPTEDMFIHNQDFKGLSWDAFMTNTRYAEWLLNKTDMSTTYRYQRRYLQLLQSRAPGAWSLKMPSHAVHIDALLAEFPDVRIVWAHRDPYKATGSLGNLWRLPKSMVTTPEGVDWHEQGRNALTQMQAHVDRPLRARERIGDDRFFHMHYSEMMRDPLAVMRDIYDWAGDELTTETESRMRSWLDAHPQNRFAPNEYHLDQFGLTVEDLKPVFAEYLDTFPAIELEGLG